ncbi:MAG: phosphate ABC transporter permease subunit PstC [Sulfitobacter sp.]
MITLLNTISVSTLILVVLGMAVAGFVIGRARSIRGAGGDARDLHSLPGYYGWFVAMCVAVPSLLITVIWLFLQPILIQNTVIKQIPEEVMAQGSSIGLVMSDVRRISDGLTKAVNQGVMSRQEVDALRADVTDVRERLAEAGVALGSDVQAPILVAAQSYRTLRAKSAAWMKSVVLAVAVFGLVKALGSVTPLFRARIVVENGVKALLILAASLAILTTLGIVFSLLFETINFFQQHPWTDFFFGRSWAPNFRGDSELSILPLLWGTIYISIIALLVAVPIGVFAAIYLSEYAGPKVRSFAKPLLEILAGIPTIVYGLFALLTVGPFLVRVFGQGDAGVFGVTWMSGATAVLTAGLVMGIMLIPFVSSLSDDIINAVPQSLRDGSYGLGATRSETIRLVVLPAALPGIVGAVLLAASRAIGETMIVVLGAGAIAQISANPLDAMTTITTRIVSQLTGDTDFASPETLVAFALGLTLFVLTLGLNVVALYIVRTYREQYE